MRATVLAVLIAASRIVYAACPAPVLLQGTSVTGAHNSLGIAVADFDKDGRMDYAVPSTFDSSVTVFLGHGDGTFAAGVAYRSGGRNPVAADFNGDGYPDLAVLNYNVNSVYVLINQGNGTFGSATAYAGVNLLSGLEVGNLNGDASPDLVVTGWVGVKVLYGAPNGTFTSELISVPGEPKYATAGDVNRDGIDEVVVLYGRQDASLYLLATFTRGPSGFGEGAIVNSSIPTQVEGIHAADFNGDGASDVVTVSRGKDVLVLLNNGDGTLASPVTYTLQVNAVQAISADINEDGHPDLIFAAINGAAGTSSLIGNGDGTFQPAVFHPMLGTTQTYSIGVGDIDGDSHDDFLFADSEVELVHVLKKLCPGKSTTTQMTQDKDSSLLRDSVQLTITVTPGDGGNPTGQVVVFDNQRWVGLLPLDQATHRASIAVQLLTAGDHAITARYQGSSDYMGSSASLNHNVYRLPFGTPQNFYAYGTSANVELWWIGTDDSASYEIWRRDEGQGWTVMATTSSESYSDSNVASGHSYFYKIRATRTGLPSTYSGFTAPDAASVRVWFLSSAGSPISHLQMEGARVAVNSVRVAAGLAPASFTDPSLQGVTMKAVHMTELRDAISEAYAAVGVSTPPFTPITPKETVVRWNDIQQILDLAH